MLVSAGVHALLFAPVRAVLEPYLIGAPPKEAGPVKVVRLTPEAWRSSLEAAKLASSASRRAQSQTEGAPAARKEEEEAPQPETPDPERPDGQIVDVPATRDDSPNPDAKFVGEHNSNVEKESVARLEQRDHTKDRRTHKLQDEAASPNTPKTLGLEVKGDEGTDPSAQGAGKGQGKGDGDGPRRFKLEIPDLMRKDEVELKLSDLPGLDRSLRNRRGSEKVEGNGERFEFQDGLPDGTGSGEQGGRAGGARGIPSLEALRPNLGTVARIAGSPSLDYVPDVAEGDGTFLNTKQFKYATFFIRVKDSVQGFWINNFQREYRRRDPTGRVYGQRDRTTLLAVVLDDSGRLDSVQIAESSGLGFLDEAAVEAFKQAQPFPNPPRGIVEQDGSIRFNFQFVVVLRPTGPFGF